MTSVGLRTRWAAIAFLGALAGCERSAPVPVVDLLELFPFT